jgi:uncharacterized protein YjbI with pentapeptide repeats
MLVDIEKSNTSGAASPALTRADIDRLLAQEGRPEKLDVRDLNLKGIDLAYRDLQGALLTRADLSGADENTLRLHPVFPHVPAPRACSIVLNRGLFSQRMRQVASTSQYRSP